MYTSVPHGSNLAFFVCIPYCPWQAPIPQILTVLYFCDYSDVLWRERWREREREGEVEEERDGGRERWRERGREERKEEEKFSRPSCILQAINN